MEEYSVRRPLKRPPVHPGEVLREDVLPALWLPISEAAGQTMGQFHFHVIPRYRGDVADPRGGIRWVIPSKARYWVRG